MIPLQAALPLFPSAALAQSGGELYGILTEDQRQSQKRQGEDMWGPMTALGGSDGGGQWDPTEDRRQQHEQQGEDGEDMWGPMASSLGIGEAGLDPASLLAFQQHFLPMPAVASPWTGGRGGLLQGRLGSGTTLVIPGMSPLPQTAEPGGSQPQPSLDGLGFTSLR